MWEVRGAVRVRSEPGANLEEDRGCFPRRPGGPSQGPSGPWVWPALILFLVLAALGGPALASPFGTTYTAAAVNFPGSATATLDFDGLEEPLGSSGLLVGESSTPFATFELLEFSLRTADGNPFVGQQLSSTDPASVSITDLFWFGDPNPAAVLANSGFLWLTVDGVAQPLADLAGLGFVFGTHPLDASIPVLFVDNAVSTTFGFGTLGGSAFDAFAALVGPALAAQIDDVHFGVAAAPVVVPEPTTGLLVALGALVAGACGARRA